MAAKYKSNNNSISETRENVVNKSAKKRRSSSSRVYDSSESQDENDFLSGLCYGDIDENESSSQSDDPEKSNRKEYVKKPNIWLLFIYLVLSPNIGWRKIKNASLRIDEYSRILFFPLLALVAACRFVDKIYVSNRSVGHLLQEAVAMFVAGFAGYYLVSLLARLFLPAAARRKIDSPFGNIYVMTIMSTLAVCTIIAEVMPWLGMLLLVPPIYSAYILVKGVRYLRIPEHETMPVEIFMVFFSFGIPLGIYFLLDFMMPPA